MKIKNIFLKIIIYLILILGTILLLFPLIFNVLNSFMSNEEIQVVYKNVFTEGNGFFEYTQMVLLPKVFSLKQYYTVLFQKPEFFKMFWNTCIIVIPSILFSTAISIMAGYGFAKFDFKFKNQIFLIYIIVMMLPYQVTIVPNFIIMDKLGLVGNWLSIILLMSCSPLGVVLLKQFISSIPDEVIESARIDGASEFMIFIKMVLPLSIHGIVAYIVIELVELWSMVEYPKVFLSDDFSYPLAVSLSTINQTDIGSAFVCAVIFTIPIVIIFLICKEHLLAVLKRL